MKHLKTYEHYDNLELYGVYKKPGNIYNIYIGYIKDDYPLFSVSIIKDRYDIKNVYLNLYKSDDFDNDKYIGDARDFIIENPELLKMILKKSLDASANDTKDTFNDFIEYLMLSDDIRTIKDSEEIGLL